mmetsp:Transcript_27452/g.80750  ORF Transcript_27452/g.80750 Transcript_27452/m.80750 type:complete len:412 (-) Transcript_27452:246-1481(-)
MQKSAATLACTLAVTAALTATAPPSAGTGRMTANMRNLGKSDLVVSEACLGTMTWGVQNNEEEAHSQIDVARSRGVNFMDAAELYPVPLTASTWKAGNTEKIIGNYFAKSGQGVRDEWVVATKCTGFFPNSPVAAEREVALGGAAPSPPPDGRLDASSVKRACDASLARLQTDRIDLYQIHWPDRYLPVFGQTQYNHDQRRDDCVPILETASALRDLIDEGKVRAIGLSNESPYGVGEWVRACEELGIADKLATIQNSYSLVDRRFDADLAESCDHYGIGLLPWSVLAGGLLSGKYRVGVPSRATPESRFEAFPEYMSRWSPKTASPRTLEAVEEYSAIAERAGMTPTELAIEFSRTRKHVARGSTIIGATTLEQLDENIGVFERETVLDEETLAAIDEVHLKCPNPSCAL